MHGFVFAGTILSSAMVGIDCWLAYVGQEFKCSDRTVVICYFKTM